MGNYTLILFILSIVFHQTFSSLDFPIGSRVSIPIPSKYQPNVKNRAYILNSPSNSPTFTAALSVEAINERYFCSLVLQFDDTKVWASDHVVKFVPTGNTCVLELSTDGNLRLMDQFGLVGWQSDTSHQGVKMLRLEERTGNLVLITESNQVIWQCFAHPTNTILWGQQLKSSSPLTIFPTKSSVYYSFEIIQDEIVAYMNWRHYKYSYWDLKPHGNRTISYMRLGVKGIKIFNRDAHKIAQILSEGTEPVRFFVLGSDGDLGFYYYSVNSRRFKHSYKLLTMCDLPLTCGLYGVCTSQNTCRYVQPKSTMEKINDIFERGVFDGTCEIFGDEIEMVQIKGVETVLKSNFYVNNMSEESCVISCKENCSCNAVVYSDKKRRCYQFGLVAGLREAYDKNGQNLWIKMLKEKNDAASGDTVKKFVIIGGIIDLIAIVVIFSALIYYYCFRIYNRKGSDISPGAERN